jgi:hypothetical protein
MKRNSVRRLLGVGLLASALASGCEHADQHQTAQAQPWRQNAVASQSLRAPSPQNTAANPPSLSIPGPASVATLPKPEFPAADSSAAVSPPDNGTVPAIAPIKDDGLAAKPPAAEDANLSPAGLTDAAAKRKSFVDITANPSFSHAPDYHWLCGQVLYSKHNNAWRLRYASVDEEDPYGGSVTLAEDPRVANLKDGQFVRVEGQFITREDKGIAPPYQVDNLQVIEK